jgi:hypothetical protein
MDFNTTGHKQRKGGRPGRSGVAGLRGGWGVGGLRGGCGGVVLRGVLVRRTESIGIH